MDYICIFWENFIYFFLLLLYESYPRFLVSPSHLVYIVIYTPSWKSLSIHLRALHVCVCCLFVRENCNRIKKKIKSSTLYSSFDGLRIFFFFFFYFRERNKQPLNYPSKIDLPTSNYYILFFINNCIFFFNFSVQKIFFFLDHQTRQMSRGLFFFFWFR